MASVEAGSAAVWNLPIAHLESITQLPMLICVQAQRVSAAGYSYKHDTPFDHLMYDAVGAQPDIGEAPPPLYEYYEDDGSERLYPDLVGCGYALGWAAVVRSLENEGDRTRYMIYFRNLISGEERSVGDVDCDIINDGVEFTYPGEMGVRIEGEAFSLLQGNQKLPMLSLYELQAELDSSQPEVSKSGVLPVAA